MARVTVEDCLDNVDNRFQLVLVATKRARQLANGVTPFLDWENDKPTIVALREIAAGLIGPSILEEQVRPEIELDEEMPEEEKEAPVVVAAEQILENSPREPDSQDDIDRRQYAPGKGRLTPRTRPCPCGRVPRALSRPSHPHRVSCTPRPGSPTRLSRP